MSAAARRRGDEARSHATRWLWAYGPSPLLFPRIRKGSLLPPLEVVLPTSHQQVYIGGQHTAGGKVIERCADNSKKDRHEITALSELRRKCPQLKTGRRA